MNRREKDITKKPLDDWITSDEIEDEDKDEFKVCSNYALRILKI